MPSLSYILVLGSSSKLHVITLLQKSLDISLSVALLFWPANQKLIAHNSSDNDIVFSVKIQMSMSQIYFSIYLLLILFKISY